MSRQYYDEHSSPTNVIPRKDAADVLGYEPKDISDAMDGKVGWVRVKRGVYYTTDEHEEDWDAEAAAEALRNHLSGRHRVDGIQKRAEVEKALAESNGKRSAQHGSPPRASRAGAEDWSKLHFWAALMDGLDELGGLTDGNGKEVTKEIKPKLTEHRVDPELVNRTGDALATIEKRLGWVARYGGPARWYLTPKYWQLIQDGKEERDKILAQWDNEGNPVAPKIPVVLANLEVEEEPKEVVPSAPDDPLNEVHTTMLRASWRGPGGATVGAQLPVVHTPEERTALQQFLKTVAERLPNLA